MFNTSLNSMHFDARGLTTNGHTKYMLDKLHVRSLNNLWVFLLNTYLVKLILIIICFSSFCSIYYYSFLFFLIFHLLMRRTKTFVVLQNISYNAIKLKWQNPVIYKIGYVMKVERIVQKKESIIIKCIKGKIESIIKFYRVESYCGFLTLVWDKRVTFFYF